MRIYTLQETAQVLAINPLTLRRWDKAGRLKAEKERTGQISRYVYPENVLEDFVAADFRALYKISLSWAKNPKPFELLPVVYCPDRSIFKARLSHFEAELKQTAGLSEIFPLIVAVAGEIGNNAYDHNLGNWPDVPGAFFGYNLKERKVILADRGQGLLKTLRNIRPKLVSHAEALTVAFTEMISGRTPEARGNGLKYVRQVVSDYSFKLDFQSGDAILRLSPRQKEVKTEKSPQFISGVFALLNY